jgi:hypothetical protein
MPNRHGKVKFSTRPSLILIKVGELVDTIENSLLAKFQHCISCSFCGAGMRKS